MMQLPTDNDLVLDSKLFQYLMQCTKKANHHNHQNHLTLDHYCQGSDDIKVDQHDGIEWSQKKSVLDMTQDPKYMLQ